VGEENKKEEREKRLWEKRNIKGAVYCPKSCVPGVNSRREQF
jgi:hypothetical protein